MKRLTCAVLVALIAAFMPATAEAGPKDRKPPLPRQVDGGTWATSHLQGAVVDRANDQILWSFTTKLVRTDLRGRLLGTVDGLTGHLGDLAQGPDGRVYGSLEYKEQKAFYVAVFDPRKINRVGLDAQRDDVMTTIYLPDVVDDFTADMDGDGRFDGDTAATADHRYGSSGIDGVAFGPRFGERGGPSQLTVAYGIYANKTRIDNDDQVLLQLDATSLRRWEKPLREDAPHRRGPRATKFFVTTGNTTYGVQNLEYETRTRRWLAAVYPGTKPQYPNHSLFVIDGTQKPYDTPVKGQAAPEIAPHLSLLPQGQWHAASGTFGWTFDASYGLVSVGGGYFYGGSGSKVVQDGVTKNSGRLDLFRWTGATPTPFERVR